jgi:hypothetical protein
MSLRDRYLTTPLRRALASAAGALIYVIVLRFVWVAFDPEMDSWSLLVIVPLLGVVTYLQETKNEAALATLFVRLGAGGLVFWGLVLISGFFPVERADVPWVLLILAFPLASLALGLRQRRQLQRPPR